MGFSATSIMRGTGSLPRRLAVAASSGSFWKLSACPVWETPQRLKGLVFPLLFMRHSDSISVPLRGTEMEVGFIAPVHAVKRAHRDNRERTLHRGLILRYVSAAHGASIRVRADFRSLCGLRPRAGYWRWRARRLPYLLFVLLLSMTVAHLPSAPGASILNV